MMSDKLLSAEKLREWVCNNSDPFTGKSRAASAARAAISDLRRALDFGVFDADIPGDVTAFWRDEYNASEANLASVSADLARAVRERDEAVAQLAELREAAEKVAGHNGLIEWDLSTKRDDLGEDFMRLLCAAPLGKFLRRADLRRMSRAAEGWRVMDWLEDVREFNRLAEQHGQGKPRFETIELRRRLIAEELQELEDAWQLKNFVGLVDAVFDGIYVTLGAFDKLSNGGDTLRFDEYAGATDIIGFADEADMQAAISYCWFQFGRLSVAMLEGRDFGIECADMLCRLLDLADICGVDMRPIWDEGHRSNMAKFGEGCWVDATGKLRKPQDWEPPQFERLLREQGWCG